MVLDSAEIFDPTWRREGFCPANGVSTHVVSGYALLALSLVGFFVYLSLRRTPGLESANVIIWTTMLMSFFHGFSHFGFAHAADLDMVAASARGIDTVLDTYYNKPAWESVVGVFIALSSVAFWMGLFRTAMPSLGHKSWLLGFFGLYIELTFPLNAVVPFGHALSSVIFSFNQVNRNDKDVAYVLQPWMVGLPSTVLALLESTQCEVFVRDYLYGHFAYDVIPVVLALAWYSVSYWNAEYVIRVKKQV